MRYGLPNPDIFKGLVVLSGVAPDEETIRDRLPEERTQPIFEVHGTKDMVIDIEMARDTRKFLEAEGFSPLYKEYEMGHEINQDVLDDLVPWIHKVLPSLRVG